MNRSRSARSADDAMIALLAGLHDFFNPVAPKPGLRVDEDLDTAEVAADALEEAGYGRFARDLRAYLDRAAPWRARRSPRRQQAAPRVLDRQWRALAERFRTILMLEEASAAGKPLAWFNYEPDPRRQYGPGSPYFPGLERKRFARPLNPTSYPVRLEGEQAPNGRYARFVMFYRGPMHGYAFWVPETRLSATPLHALAPNSRAFHEKDPS